MRRNALPAMPTVGAGASHCEDSPAHHHIRLPCRPSMRTPHGLCSDVACRAFKIRCRAFKPPHCALKNTASRLETSPHLKTTASRLKTSPQPPNACFNQVGLTRMPSLAGGPFLLDLPYHIRVAAFLHLHPGPPAVGDRATPIHLLDHQGLRSL